MVYILLMLTFILPCDIAAMKPEEGLYEPLLAKSTGAASSDELERPALHDAVVYGKKEEVRQLLQDGAPILVKDERGMTVFHCIAQQAGLAGKDTLKALFISPRLCVVRTIEKMNIPPEQRIERMCKWHIAGLVKGLLMRDAEGKTSQESAQNNIIFWWSAYFCPDPGWLAEEFGADIWQGYSTIGLKSVALIKLLL